MAQKTNLNISPYYDDFSSEKNFYKVLYKPGFPVQARELTSSQSILQNQIQSFGDHIFKEGSVVIPGNIAYVGNYSAVKIQEENYGIDISLYIKDFIGKKITGVDSGVSAIVKYVALPTTDDVDDITIYVTYVTGDKDSKINPFSDGERLTCSDNVTYGNTTINSGTPFASLISSDATAIGSAAYITKGVYFIRGYFVNVTDQIIILDYYSNAPSYRVGLKVDELLVGAKDDQSLYDNAKGFSNYAAPGADRLKINLTLIKKELDDQDDTDFVELLRVKKGQIKIINSQSNYNIIKDWIAERTYDESGDYTVDPFKLSIHDSLNDNLGNGGLFDKNEQTDQLNTPSKDLMALKISDGKAYVKGYDYEKGGTTIIDVEKPRDVGINSTASVNFDMGSVLRVNNVSGIVKQGGYVQLFSGFGQEAGTNIGTARAYDLSLRNQEYSDATTVWDLRLFDIQTTTQITLNSSVTSTQLPVSSLVKGKSSGASGYAVSAGSNSTRIDLNQTTGTFAKGEQIEINGVDFPRTIGISTANTTQSIKSVQQVEGDNYGGQIFKADSVLDIFSLPNGIRECRITAGVVAGISTITAGAKQFSGLRVGATIVYNKGSNSSDPTYNKVKSIGVGNTSIVVEAISPSIPGIFDGSLPNTTPSANVTVPIAMNVGAPIIRGTGILHAPLSHRNVSTVDLSDSKLRVTKQLNIGQVSSSAETVNMSDVVSVYPEISETSTFEPFDEERYSLHYDKDGATAGQIAKITEDTFSYVNGQQIVITNLTTTSEADNYMNLSIKKDGVVSKIKNYNRSKMVDVIYSKYEKSGTTATPTGSEGFGLTDGLIYDKRYGLRVQDERISLNYPDVVKFIAVYESIDNTQPTLDQFRFSSTADVQTNAVLGENIVGYNSKAIARIVNKSTTDANTLGIVYLTATRFAEGETVNFEESNIDTNIEAITTGIYKDITNSFKLDKGQKDQYYDYSSITRNSGVSEPSGRLLVIFDYYSVPVDDDGDLFTAMSYDAERFQYDIPNIGISRIRASDTLDFRPRVSVYDTDPSANTRSPFAFESRVFSGAIKQYLIPNESTDLGYEYYLPRIDKVYLNKFGEFVYEKGLSSIDPKPPLRVDDSMDLGTVFLPPYLYTTQSAKLSLVDNRRYTMRDIGYIDDRVSNLEEVTTLSLLESNVQSLQIQDSEGRSRFKTGFFVDPFRNYRLINGLSRIQINPQSQTLIPVRSRNTLASQPTPKLSITSRNIDFNTNFDLFDGNVQKTGNVITLKYDEETWLEQPYATKLKDGSFGIINVNPYELPAIIGNVELEPNTDVWTRTHQLEDNIIHQTGTNSTVDMSLSSSGSIDLGNHSFDTESHKHIVTSNHSIKAGSNTNSTTQDLSGSTVLEASDSVEISNTDVTIQNRLVSSAAEDHMRSRNTEFKATALTSFVDTYLFLDGQKIEDITPKLLAITPTRGGDDYGSTGTAPFLVGEDVVVEDVLTNTTIMRFRVCTPNHKEGPFNAPTEVYSKDPYSLQQISNTGYTQTSAILNIDTRALAEEAQGLYSGYLVANAKLVGQESGAVAYVKDWDNTKMVTDEYGDIIGTFYLRDPNAVPQPSVKVTTGRKSVRVTTSSSNKQVAPGQDANVVWGEGIYTAQGTHEVWQNDRIIRTDTTTVNASFRGEVAVEGSITHNHTTTQTVDYVDPVAQTFVVGGPVQAPSAVGANDDLDGVVITAAEVFFASIDEDANAPIRCEIRSTTGDARPSMTLMGRSKTLYPFTTNSSGTRVQNIQFDAETASVGTKFTFPDPIYLPPGASYALVLVAESSVNYTVWLAEHGGQAVNPQSIPGSTGESTRYSRQYGAGALFKSQNGALWTEDQTQDLKFVIYKAKFTSTEGSAFFNNPDLNESNGYVPTLRNNPIRTLPKTGSVKIDYYDPASSKPNSAINQLSAKLKVGKMITGKHSASTAIIDSFGSRANSVGILTTGSNYVTDSSVETYSITGQGSGLKLDITADSDGAISNASIIAGDANKGSGYKTGDVVGIVTSTVGTSGGQGKGAEITVTITGDTIDTLYLTDIKGEVSASGDWTTGIGLTYVDDNNGTLTYRATARSGDSGGGYDIEGININTTGINSGTSYRVDHFNHGMYSSTNKVKIEGIKSDVPGSTLSAPISLNETSTISVASTLPFHKFEGVEVNPTTGYIGYVKIGNEIIGYQNATSSGLSIAASPKGRGVDGTITIPHDIGDTVEKYEVGGVSIRRLEVEQTLGGDDIGLDHYDLKVDTSARGGLDLDRSVDKDASVYGNTTPQLTFKNDSFVGGSNVKASQNIIYSGIVPRYNTVTPSGPNAVSRIDASIRTVSGTSVSGIENSFNDQGYRSVQLNRYNNLDEVSIVASKINENEYLPSLPRSKSFTSVLNLFTNNENISPMIYLSGSSIEFVSNRLNSPIGIDNYPSDSRVNSIVDDPHSAIYYSNIIRLSKPATSLKILLSASKPASSDIRVLYQLERVDSSEVEQEFELFPGYKNLIDNDEDGFGDIVIDPFNNDGTSDSFVGSNENNQFFEYQYTADNLDLFTGYSIKIVMSGTNQAKPPRIRELRSIAVRWLKLKDIHIFIEMKKLEQ